MTTDKPRGWHRADIIAAIHKSGETLVSLALANGYSASTLRSGLHYPAKAQHEIIAKHLGKSLHEIWPQWYGPDGTQLVSIREAIRQTRVRRVQKDEENRQPSTPALTAEERS